MAFIVYAMKDLVDVLIVISHATNIVVKLAPLYKKIFPPKL